MQHLGLVQANLIVLVKNSIIIVLKIHILKQTFYLEEFKIVQSESNKKLVS